MQPSSLQPVEDRQENWTVFLKLDKWIDDAKSYLIKKLVDNKPMIWMDTGEISEVTFDSVVECHMITFDETEHPLSLHHDRGGRRSKSYTNLSFFPSGSHMTHG